MRGKNIIIATGGGAIGIAHLGMIGMLSTRNTVPVFQPPVGPYTSYMIQADKDGYKMSYRANDPMTMMKTTTSKVKGLTKTTEKTVVDEYTMDGKTHLGAIGSTAQQAAQNVECIKAEGGGEQTGKVVGASVGAAAAPAVMGVPFIGPVLGGLVALVGMNKGGEIGGQIATEFSASCDEDGNSTD